VSAGRQLGDIDLVAPVALEFASTATDAAAAVRRHAAGYAFTIGAMGGSGRNFYNEAFTRLGYGEGVRTVESLWRAGDRDAARDAVPDDLGRLTNLVGTDQMISERLERYRAAGISTLLVKLDTPFDEQLRALDRLFALL
jgi:alkanesulfonate monooxygenase SsuD/methylene tetrahydromethanopterin reductase-like flavin-dependent oxidoreductase (luciferase family)